MRAHGNLIIVKLCSLLSPWFVHLFIKNKVLEEKTLLHLHPYIHIYIMLDKLEDFATIGKQYPIDKPWVKIFIGLIRLKVCLR